VYFTCEKIVFEDQRIGVIIILYVRINKYKEQAD
jgi:hypothetical protein